MSVEVDDVWLYEIVLTYLKKIEENCPPLVRESPHFLNGDRKAIVQWIGKLTKVFKSSIEAHHLAVFLFDYFIADHQADAQGLYLIGAACFSVACKVNDIETNVPQASKILKCAPFENVMQSYLLKSTEILVLQHFNWNVLRPTEASFLDYYAASCLAIELEYLDNADYSTNLAKYYNKWISYFREIILYNDEFRDYRPSKIASSVVIATRISIGLVPDWPDFMVHLTGWFKTEVIQIVDKLRQHLKSDEISQTEMEFVKDFNNHTNSLKYNEPYCRGDNNTDFIYTKLLHGEEYSSISHAPLSNGDLSNHNGSLSCNQVNQYSNYENTYLEDLMLVNQVSNTDSSTELLSHNSLHPNSNCFPYYSCDNPFVQVVYPNNSIYHLSSSPSDDAANNLCKTDSNTSLTISSTFENYNNNYFSLIPIHPTSVMPSSPVITATNTTALATNSISTGSTVYFLLPQNTTTTATNNNYNYCSSVVNNKHSNIPYTGSTSRYIINVSNSGSSYSLSSIGNETNLKTLNS